MSNLPSLSDTIRRAGLKPSKRLGQNFLLDQNLTDKIVSVAGDLTQCTVIEIGPGPGGLTRSLLAADAKKVITIEFDPRCKEILQELKYHYGGRFEYIIQDALTIDASALVDDPKKIVANLPYNVATSLLLQWLQQIESFESLTLMFQKEVADRLLANPRTSAYGRLSVMTQWRATVDRAFNVPARAFTPSPKVDSTVVHLRPRKDFEAGVTWRSLETVTKVAFQKRRKMLRSTLRALFPENLENILRELDITPTARAEELSVQQFVNLARCWQHSLG
ncbi:MAG: 16S rRNA (adenine(1518)-N(6)/adenine(1519)-N(6))-dimethyltransferase RsmA [Pseudomonadota bacterium]